MNGVILSNIYGSMNMITNAIAFVCDCICKVDFCVRSYLFRSIASKIIRDCIILSGERECDARDCFKS